jgi:valyl-tRNA synthetase
MGFPKRYDAAEAERRLQDFWAHEHIYTFALDPSRPIFAVDTPPPTVSGDIHIGHVYSYVQAEAMIRFWRMQGFNVYYPFGFDDNGLPTERYVERRRGVRARDVRRAAFIAACLEVSQETEDAFERFWKRLGMSVDWRLRYSTIDPGARRLAQWSFIDLHRKGLVYRAQAPNPWCAECQTAIAQAEMDDVERTTVFYTLAFGFVDERRTTNDERRTTDDGRSTSLQSPVSNLQSLLIATTRPELLPACVAVFVHPEDARYLHLIGQEAITPLFGRRVPILADAAVDPQKGTGAVMCCTFGDSMDVEWWRTHKLPLIPLVTRQGMLSDHSGSYAGLTLRAARERIIADLAAAGAITERRETAQTVRVHERCGTPLEILETSQWFIRVLDAKDALLEAGRKIAWHPAYMQARYEHWVENLSWDWCISRQRAFGVPFPAWHCAQCGETILADEAQLPLDPATAAPPRACACGNAHLQADEDVMDTWATSSVSPLIAALRWNEINGDTRSLAEQLATLRPAPMQLRPQAHDIIRTWAFYTIVKSHYHFGTIPWETIMISGHGLDPAGRKIDKSKGNAPVTPIGLIDRYGADAVRYWACGGRPGADQPISEEEMKQGARLVTKLWNAARFAESQIGDRRLEIGARVLQSPTSNLQWSDRALLSWMQRLVERATADFRAYDYAAARDATERFFWHTLCDNYLEWVKARLYDGTDAERQAAQYTLYHTLLALLKLFAPIIPHITEEIYQRMYVADGAGGDGAGGDGAGGDGVGVHGGSALQGMSIHRAGWPTVDASLIDPAAERVGAAMLALTGYVRRFKAARQMSLGAELPLLQIAADDEALHTALERSVIDLRSVTRAREITFVDHPADGMEEVEAGLWVSG